MSNTPFVLPQGNFNDYNTLADANALAFKDTGMIVYIISEDAFYYWNGSAFTSLTTGGGGGGSGWNLTGNAGTVAGTNFIGTTDNIDFVYKRNSVEILRLILGGLSIKTPTAGVLTANTEKVFGLFDGSATQTWAAGTVPNQRHFLFKAPTYILPGFFTNSATVTIDNAPITVSGANPPVALWIQDGGMRLDNGILYVGPFPDTQFPNNDNPISGYRNVDGSCFMSMQNANAGNDALAGFSANNDLGHGTYLISTSSTFASFPSDIGGIAAEHLNGLMIATLANAPILFKPNNIEAMRIANDGSIGIGITPNAAAILDIQSTTGGVKFPNMTTVQRSAIANLAGNVVYDTDINALYLNNGSLYTPITTGTNVKNGSFAMTINGNGSVITTGQKGGFITIPYSGIITGWDIESTNGITGAALTGAIVIDVWKADYASFPPTVANTIFGTKPSLSAQSKNSATGLSIAVTAGDKIGINIDSVTTCVLVNFSLSITKN